MANVYKTQYSGAGGGWVGDGGYRGKAMCQHFALIEFFLTFLSVVMKDMYEKENMHFTYFFDHIKLEIIHTYVLYNNYIYILC